MNQRAKPTFWGVWGKRTWAFLGLSLLSECERWCERGLAALQEADHGTLHELALQEGLSISSMFTRGNSEEVRTTIEQALGLVRRCRQAYQSTKL